MRQQHDLAADIRRWRHREAISAAELARRLDMPKRTLDGIEQGRPFRYSRLLKLALIGLEEVGDGNP
ncbi:helix-turn-helix domain-containing protein [Sinorhizobium meliloti]|uniref:helix-turn-helix domain-containing protein n=1 Tax=Rhizobium meliloti TaxID=382 RepID=UPI000FE0FA34|nr:helix-turn-helix transcriptional regulator [Sinorhizobium meliloti]MDX0719658.1 helix-turn-helix domain-containing protein [Sinorhizobium medicae]MDW9898496.1 helix-turn-helix domain-containing protein [Sinorhizobium meliloti]MDX0911068.1 helix-turn-helix domain-containing protein [Sinorhizobium medicae]MDX1083228.1 helix-turn-helix domain-containing protein [Sinorhizobium medicae]MDX1186338.1 helix-turn-helix domain-containing protein [Sinorhizobium medicae]